MRALLIVAHPLDNAFAKAAAARIRATLERRGIEVDMIDLYADDFDPCLTGAERRGYFTTPYTGVIFRSRRSKSLSGIPRPADNPTWPLMRADAWFRSSG